MSGKTGKRKQKPPPRWRRHLVQAELELPPASPSSLSATGGDASQFFAPDPEWWQKPAAVGGLAAFAAALLVLTGISLHAAHRDREIAAAAELRARTLTLRATTTERVLRIAPNPRSWSGSPDASIRWPEPPELLDLHLPVAYSEFNAFSVTIDKVNEGRVLIVQRMVPDSNRDLRLSLNSSSFGPGEYRIRLQGYTWRGERVDAGWVRLVVQ
jgi:hypothetical protein